MLQKSAVEISDVTFSGIRGTADCKYGITLGAVLQQAQGAPALP